MGEIFKEGVYCLNSGEVLRCRFCGSSDFDYYGPDNDDNKEYDEYQCRECLSFTKIYEGYKNE